MRHRRPFMFPIILIAGLAGFSLAVMLLWNHILSPVLGVNTIGFWQAAGILVLSKILFGFRFFGGGPWRHRHHHHGKWRHLSPEERQKFREKWRHRHHHHQGDQEENQ